MQVNCCLWKLTSLDPSHLDSTQALLPLQGGVQSLSWQIGTQPLFICISKPLHKACQKVFWFSPLNLPFLPPVLLPRWLSGKESACNAGAIGDSGMIPGSGRSSGEGNGNPLQNSCLENPMDREAWWATVHRVTEESDSTERTHSWMVKPDNEIWFSTKKKWAMKPWEDMEGTGMYITKWKKPTWKGRTVCDSNPIIFWERQCYGDSEKNSGC